MTLGYKGSAWAEIVVRRSMAHSAGEGENAPEMAVGLWTRIQEWAATYNQDRGRVFDQVSPILGGFSSSDDGFEGTASLEVGVRLPSSMEPKAWYAQLRTLIPEAVCRNTTKWVTQSQHTNLSEIQHWCGPF